MLSPAALALKSEQVDMAERMVTVEVRARGQDSGQHVWVERTAA